MAHDAFISYSSRDKTVGDAVCATLEANGIRCWIAPRDIAPGADWGESIIAAIQAARVFVLVFSAHANASQQITREVERAVHNGIAIIPLRIEEVVPQRSLEYFLSTPHWLDAFTPPLERHLKYLAAVVRQIVDGAAESLPHPPAPPPLPFYRRRAVIGGGVATIAALTGVGGWLALRPGAPPSFVGKWQGAKISIEVAQGPNNTDPLADLFVAAFTGPGGSATFEVSEVGQYTYTVSGEDHGTVAIAPGQQPPSAMLSNICRASGVRCGSLTFTSVSQKSVVRGYEASTYKLENGSMDGGQPGEVTLMIATQNWHCNLYGNSADGVVGRWHNLTFIWGDIYNLELEITAAATYQLRISRSEHGLFQADGGKWTQTPSSGAPLTGSYEFSGANLVTVVSARSSIQWKRST